MTCTDGTDEHDVEPRSLRCRRCHQTIEETATVIRATYSDGVSVDVECVEDAAQIEGVERTLQVVQPPEPQKQETWRDRPPML